MNKFWFFYTLAFSIFISNCTQKQDSSESSPPKSEITSLSPNLKIIPLSPHTYIHQSTMVVPSFGKVSCNGMIFVHNGEALVADTPSSDSLSQMLIDWLQQDRGIRIKGVIPTHFHIDCLGGLGAFHRAGIPSHGSTLTHELAQKDSAALPELVFDGQMILKIGGQEVHVRFEGEGHTRDNVVVWIPEDEVLFGGCLVKSVGAGEGNLADANVQAWPETIRQINSQYPNLKHVIPGHGKAGGTELLDFTIELFSEKE